MNVYHSAMECIGRTPLLALRRLTAQQGVEATLLAKMEGQNPSGSVKDRVALAMIEAAEAQGRLRPGATVIEPTSGNTGIGLAAVGAAKGYKVVLVMPETMSIERRNLIAAYGAEVVLTDGKLGMRGAIEKAQELSRQTPGSLLAGQFVNPANPGVHEAATGPEIWRDTDGAVDVFVAGVGTGGTITGVGTYLKAQNPRVRIVAVEPDRSPVLSGGAAGPHGIQGIGAGFVPDVLAREVIDEIVRVRDEDAFATARRIARTEGVLAGASSGAATFAALQLAARPENAGKTIVTLWPDRGERYLSTGLFT